LQRYSFAERKYLALIPST